MTKRTTTVKTMAQLPKTISQWRVENAANRKAALAGIKVYRTAFGLVTIPE